MEQARLALEAAAAVLKQKRETYAQAVAAHTEQYVYFDMQLSGVETMLRAAAPAFLNAYITDCWNRIHELRDKGLQSVRMRTENYNIERGTYHHVIINNADAVNATLRGLQNAAQSAEGLKLANMTEEELRARLAALDASIPPLAGVGVSESPPASLDEAVRTGRESHALAKVTARAIDWATVRARQLRGH
jgi:hypothetical protein